MSVYDKELGNGDVASPEQRGDAELPSEEELFDAIHCWADSREIWLREAPRCEKRYTDDSEKMDAMIARLYRALRAERSDAPKDHSPALSPGTASDAEPSEELVRQIRGEPEVAAAFANYAQHERTMDAARVIRTVLKSAHRAPASPATESGGYRLAEAMRLACIYLERKEYAKAEAELLYALLVPDADATPTGLPHGDADDRCSDCGQSRSVHDESHADICGAFRPRFAALATDEEVERFTQRLQRALRDEPLGADDDLNPSLIRLFLNDFLAARATGDATPQKPVAPAGPTKAWLIERGQREGYDPPQWFNDALKVWTPDASQASLYPNVDWALTVMRQRGLHPSRATEHVFLDNMLHRTEEEEGRND